jgi:hypothetical protein
VILSSDFDTGFLCRIERTTINGENQDGKEEFIEKKKIRNFYRDEKNWKFLFIHFLSRF